MDSCLADGTEGPEPFHLPGIRARGEAARFIPADVVCVRANAPFLDATMFTLDGSMSVKMTP